MLRCYRYSLQSRVLTHLAFSENTQYLAAVGSSESVRVWSINMSENESFTQSMLMDTVADEAAPSDRSISIAADVEQYRPVDQGFFRNLLSKIGRAEMAHTRWNIQNTAGENKKCAFTHDEKSLLVVTDTGKYYKLAVSPGEHIVSSKPKSIL